MALILEPDLKFTAQDVEKFLAFMSIRFTAAPAGFDAKKVRFHGGVAPGKEFHADLGTGFEDLALGGTNEGLDVPIRLKHRKDIGLVETCDALESSDRRAHLAAFESTQEANRHTGGTSDLREREAALEAHAAEGATGSLASIGGSSDGSLLLQNVHNRGGIQAAGAAEKHRALEQANVRFGVHAVAACSAFWADQTQGFPRAQGRRRDPQAVGDLRNAQEALARERFRYRRQILST